MFVTSQLAVPNGKHGQAVADAQRDSIQTAFFALGRALLDVRGMVIELRQASKLSAAAAEQFERNSTACLSKIDEFFRALGHEEPPPPSQRQPSKAKNRQRTGVYSINRTNGGRASGAKGPTKEKISGRRMRARVGRARDGKRSS